MEVQASPSTLYRLAKRADHDTAWAIHELLFSQFVAAHPIAPRRLILEFDATDTPLHGKEEAQLSIRTTGDTAICSCKCSAVGTC